MVKGDGLQVLDPANNDRSKFLGCEQCDKILTKKVLTRVKKEMSGRLRNLVELIYAINIRVTPVAAYIMNVCNTTAKESRMIWTRW